MEKLAMNKLLLKDSKKKLLMIKKAKIQKNIL